MTRSDRHKIFQRLRADGFIPLSDFLTTTGNMGAVWDAVGEANRTMGPCGDEEVAWGQQRWVRSPVEGVTLHQWFNEAVRLQREDPLRVLSFTAALRRLAECPDELRGRIALRGLK